MSVLALRPSCSYWTSSKSSPAYVSNNRIGAASCNTTRSTNKQQGKLFKLQSNTCIGWQYVKAICYKLLNIFTNIKPDMTMVRVTYATS